MKTVGRRGAGGSWRSSGPGLFLLKVPPGVLRSGYPKDRLRFISPCPDHSHAGAVDLPIAVPPSEAGEIVRHLVFGHARKPQPAGRRSLVAGESRSSACPPSVYLRPAPLTRVLCLYTLYR